MQKINYKKTLVLPKGGGLARKLKGFVERWEFNKEKILTIKIQRFNKEKILVLPRGEH